MNEANSLNMDTEGEEGHVNFYPETLVTKI
jgi:hypothetical protein